MRALPSLRTPCDTPKPTESDNVDTHTAGVPSFRDLDDAEARLFLQAHHVGRVAYSFRDRVDIAPIHYVADDEWIFARTSEGGKLTTLSHNPWCAFEVDSVRGMFEWTSVVVKGQLTVLHAESAPLSAARERGLSLLRELIPSSLTPRDPAPERTVLVRLHIAEITGREAILAPGRQQSR